jgi:hypothetical protein
MAEAVEEAEAAITAAAGAATSVTTVDRTALTPKAEALVIDPSVR